MQEIEGINEFDYSVIDEKTQEFLYEKEYIISGIHNRYSKEMGKVFYEAQQRLAKKGNGLFEKWFASLGFKKTNVYNYINVFENVQQLNELDAEVFEKLPKKLQIEMSKPSANQELNQKVFDGDITNHKQYKEIEKKLNEQETQLKQQSETIKLQSKMIDDLNEKEPEIVEKPVEVVPDDYQDLKNNEQALKRRLERLESRNEYVENQRKQMLEERAEVNEKSAKYDELTQAINQAEGKLSKTQKRIADYKKFNTLLRKSNNFLLEASALAFYDLSDFLEKDLFAKDEINSLVNNLEHFLKELKEATKNKEILEGEIING